jgi:hypothetical protein
LPTGDAAARAGATIDLGLATAAAAVAVPASMVRRVNVVIDFSLGAGPSKVLLLYWRRELWRLV